MERFCDMLVRLSQRFACRSLLLIGLLASPARAEADKKTPPSPGPLPAAVAVVPGLLVHGAGHYAAGDPATGRTLLAAEGIGLAGIFGPGALLVVTGASRRFIGALAAGVVGGVGIFAISGLADIYGASGLRGGDPVTVAPSLETRVGAIYAYDPLFQYRWFLSQGVQGRVGSWKVQGGAAQALDDRNGWITLGGGYRLWGPGPEGASRDGSFLDVDVAGTQHRYGTERFVHWTGEVQVNGRLDLVRVGPSLRGSFAELGVGRALQIYEYRVRGAVTDINELLLARFAFGWYPGRPGSSNGEVSFGYDHRHDGLAAGLKLRGLGSGVAGHFEARGRWFRGAWGVGAEAQVGSAYVVGLSLLFRQGGPW
jgi:hypothetical protein